MERGAIIIDPFLANASVFYLPNTGENHRYMKWKHYLEMVELSLHKKIEVFH